MAGDTSCAVRLCDGGAPQMSLFVADGAPWRATSGGYLYRSSAMNPDGFSRLLFKARGDRSKILLMARESNLTLPALPLAQSPAEVILQLVKNAGSGSECWESRFSAPSTNTDSKFKDRVP